ncbi:hypothetical protein [Undibacterium sp.]|uniref:hypothetical protein n=1 Tax=Undibacterium sp. TaxID=1914977 RepID=UPI002732071C|nr:hypothetical protein [Undibacterium sp.]MDP1980400.1 hypothetical protein [Undibacterium sp.]
MKLNDKVQTIDGRDFDPSRDAEDRIKWVANEGIRVSRVINRSGKQICRHCEVKFVDKL